MGVPVEPFADRLPIPNRLNVVLLGLASLASASLLFGASHSQSGWLVLTYAIAFSFTANTLFSLLHEAVHGLFSDQRGLNDWAGRWAAAWFPTGFSMQRAFHLTHHRNNRSAAEQFDVLHSGDVTWLKYAQWYAILTGLYWLIAVAGVLIYLIVPRAVRARMLHGTGAKAAEQTSANEYLGALDGLDPIKARLEVLGSVAFQTGLCWMLDLSMLGWAACYAAFAFSWSSLQYTDHAFTPLDPKDGAWNLRVNPIVRAFFLNYHFHLAHHQRPSVPWIHLPSLVVPGPRFLDVWREAWRGPKAVRDFPRFAVGPVASPQRWSLPTGTDASVAASFGLAFLAIFGFFFGGASILSGFIPWHAEVALPFELEIPFRPEWSLVYLSLIPFLLILPLALRGWRELFPVFSTLAAETVVASVIFLAVPVQNSFPARHAAGLWGDLFLLADTLNLERNLFPSLHVALGVTAALALAPKVGRWGMLVSSAWTAAIAASTLLIHEHHCVDVIAGVLLAALVWRHIGGWAAREDVLARVDIEILCLRNEWIFARRHLRYGLIALLLLIDSLPHWRQRRVLRTGFCFLQAVDDLLDGDRSSNREPLHVVDELMQAIRSSNFGDDDLMRLAKAFVSDLQHVAGEAAVEDVLKLMSVMRRDRCRVLDHAVWEEDELREHHRATFTLSLDLLLAAQGAQMRATDVPELIDAFGWCSTVRDLREDLVAGLINVPKVVVQAAGVSGPNPPDLDALIASDAMRSWMIRERSRAIDLLDSTERRLDQLQGRPGVAVLRLFTRSIREVASVRFARLFPSL